MKIIDPKNVAIDDLFKNLIEEDIFHIINHWKNELIFNILTKVSSLSLNEVILVK